MKLTDKNITLITKPSPDIISLQQFKNRVSIHIKSGYKADGDLKINQDGSYTQKLVKR